MKYLLAILILVTVALVSFDAGRETNRQDTEFDGMREQIAASQKRTRQTIRLYLQLKKQFIKAHQPPLA